jgi:hypothetical protein
LGIALAFQLVWRLTEFAFLVRFTSVAALFYMLIGGFMSENIQKKVIYTTGIKLMPGKPDVCPGNGEQVFECCCDECDHYLLCFPELDLNNEEFKNIKVPPPSKRHKIRMNRLFRERVGGTFLPFPEADNFYERVRSKFIIKFKINEFSDRRKKRRAKR